MEFRWNEWNTEHIAEHGVGIEEAEHVVRNARPPFPRRAGGGRYLVWGRGPGGDLLQVVYILDPHPTRFVIHARPLDARQVHQYRRIRRRT